MIYQNFKVFSLLFILTGFSMGLHAQLNANFETDTTKGCGILPGVKFTDLSTGGATSWSWDFGDGSFSTNQNPTKSFINSGRYTVKLVISDGVTSDSITKTDLIIIDAPPSADYSVDTLSGCPTLPVNFTDLSTAGGAPIKEWRWDFGDGSFLTGATGITNDYTFSGSFSSSLTVTDSIGCKSSKTGATITVLASPVARFTSSSSPSTCQGPLTVKFINQTLNDNGGVTYKWDFGDGTTSTQKEPTKIYTATGSYDVKLVADNGFCSDSITIAAFADITSSFASFEVIKDTMCFNIYGKIVPGEPNLVPDTLVDTLQFINNSLGAENFRWDFGDGTISTQKSPTHFYQDTGNYQIKLRVSSGNCVDDTAINVYVQRVISSFLKTPGDICNPGDTFFYAAEANFPVIYSWKFQTGTGQEQKTGQTTFFKQDEVGFQFLDTLITESTAGCKDTVGDPFTHRETRIPVLQVGVGMDTLFNGCSPLSFNFFPTNEPQMGDPRAAEILPGSVFWDFGNGVTSTDSIPSTQTYVKDTIYTLQLSVIDTGCNITVEKQIRVGLPTNPVVFMEDDSICIRDTIVLRETSLNPLIESRIWFLKIDDTTREDFGNGDLVKFPIQRFPEADTGTYNIILETDYNGCKDTVDTSFYVGGPKAKPYITIDTCNKRTYTFFSFAEGADTYLWDFGDGNDSAGSIFPKHTYAQDGIYKVKSFTSNSITGCELVDSFALRVFPIISGVSTNDSAGCAPYTTTIRGPASQFVSYDWVLDGENVGRGKDLTITFDTANTYEVQLIQRNSFCADTSIQIIKVSQPNTDISIKALDICVPQQYEFKDLTTFEGSALKRSWDFGNGISGTKDIDTISYLEPDSLYTVSLFVEDGLGCTDTLIYIDTILTPNIVVEFAAFDSSLCFGEPLRFINNSIGSGQTYKWDFGDGTTSTLKNPVHTYTDEGVFDVSLKMTDNNNCVITTTIENFTSTHKKPKAGFTSTGQNSECPPFIVTFTDTSISPFITKWDWNSGNGKRSIKKDPEFLYERGDFDVTLIVSTDNGCADTARRAGFIKVRGPTAEINISKDTVCKFERVRFEIINPIDVGSFNWEFGDGNTSKDTVAFHSYEKTGFMQINLLLFSDPAGLVCPQPFLDTVFVEDVIARFDVLPDTIGCEPFTADFDNTSNRADAWFWDFGDGGTTGDFSTTYTFQNEGIYEVEMNISNVNGCVDTARQEIIVERRPEAIVTQDTLICEGDVVTLTASGGDLYEWTPTTGLLESNRASVRTNTTAPIDYKVLVSSTYGCLDSAEVAIDVQPKPERYFLSNDSTIIVGEEIELDVFSGSSFSYRWSPDTSINCLDCPDPTVQALDDIRYYVEITDSNNCFRILDSIYFNVEVVFSLDVPNSFSPNGDGTNDKIYVRGWGLKELLEFKIFNRFGELVYDSQNLEEGWDGNYRGQPQNIETYIYVVSVLTFEDEVLSKKGNITLMR